MLAHQALQRLREGNARFVAGRVEQRDHASRRAEVASGQSPFATILSCADSRVPPELVFDQGLGDLFVVRVAGNLAGAMQLASIEFAATSFSTPLVMVLGHTRCGAVEAALATREGLVPPGLAPVVGPVAEAVTGAADMDEAVRANVRAAAGAIREGSDVLRGLVADGSLDVVGAVYDLGSGAVDVLDDPGA